MSTKALAIIEIEHAALHNAAHSGSLKLSLCESRRCSIAQLPHMMSMYLFSSFHILISIFIAPSPISSRTSSLHLIKSCLLHQHPHPSPPTSAEPASSSSTAPPTPPALPPVQPSHAQLAHCAAAPASLSLLHCSCNLLI